MLRCGSILFASAAIFLLRAGMRAKRKMVCSHRSDLHRAHSSCSLVLPAAHRDLQFGMLWGHVIKALQPLPMPARSEQELATPCRAVPCCAACCICVCSARPGCLPGVPLVASCSMDAYVATQLCRCSTQHKAPDSGVCRIHFSGTHASRLKHTSPAPVLPHVLVKEDWQAAVALHVDLRAGTQQAHIQQSNSCTKPAAMLIECV
jgi:hypothetical protein